MSKPVIAITSFSTRFLETEKDAVSTLEYTNLTSQMRKETQQGLGLLQILSTQKIRSRLNGPLTNLSSMHIDIFATNT